MGRTMWDGGLASSKPASRWGSLALSYYDLTYRVFFMQKNENSLNSTSINLAAIFFFVWKPTVHSFADAFSTLYLTASRSVPKTSENYIIL